MAVPIFTISTARQKFFDLFEAVTAHRGRKIVITRRGAVNRAEQQAPWDKKLASFGK